MKLRALGLTFCSAFVLLMGCNDPDVSVSSMGEKISSPVLQSSSPFSQDFNSQQYVELSGVCDSHVTSMQFSVDGQTWYTIPAQPNVSGTNLPTTTTNQITCGSTGTFNFYVTQSDLNTWLGTGNSSDINTIYLQGITAIGPTTTLTLTNSDSDGSNVASLLTLTKVSPAGYGSAGQCTYFFFQLTDSSGDEAVSTSDVAVSLQSLSDGALSTVTAYNSVSDCQSTTNGQTTFTIPAGANSLTFVYQMPVFASGLDGTASATTTLQLLPATTSKSIAATTSYTNVVVRDSSSSSIYRWIGFNNYSNMFHDLCYPLQLQRNYYGTSTGASDPEVSVTITPSTAQAAFYTDSSCTTSASTFTIPASSNDTTVYVKYTGSTTSDNNFTSFTYTMATTATGNLTYDFDIENFHVDLSSLSTPTALSITGPNSITTDTCNSYSITSVNANQTPLPMTTSASLSFSATVGNFYIDSSCVTVLTGTGVSSQTLGTTVYYKATVTSSTNDVLTVTSPNLTSGTMTTTVSP